MGASLEDAQLAFKSGKMRSETPTHTHPPTSQRLKAVEAGWRRVGKLEEKNVRVADVNRPNLGFRDSLTRIASDSGNGFSNLIGKPDSRKDIFESEIALPGAIETIVKPYHSVQAWMSNTDKLEDAESYYNFLVQQLRLAFPAWKHGEENPDVQKLIKSFVSESNDGQTYISLYIRRINDDSFYVKLNVFTRARKP